MPHHSMKTKAIYDIYNLTLKLTSYLTHHSLLVHEEAKPASNPRLRKEQTYHLTCFKEI